MGEFGIDIPLLASRSEQIAQDLAQRGYPEVVTSFEPEPLDWAALALTHASSYTSRIANAPDRVIEETYELVRDDGGYHRYDPAARKRPLSDLRDQQLLEAAGTHHCARAALDLGAAYFLGGGMHHAQYDFPRGFCMVNDIAIALRLLRRDGKIGGAVIIDTDAHKGDGTAALLAGDAWAKTLSIHMANNWPLDLPPFMADGRPDPAFIPSDVDIPIAKGHDGEYLERLHDGLGQLDKLMPAETSFAFVVNGSDPSYRDILPSADGLALTDQQMLDRDLMVWRWLAERGIPSCWLMAGGYGDEVYQVHSNFLATILAESRF